MLMNCPRCGFSQPKDQYCAQCGVDMVSYKPKRTPLFVRLAQNTSVQIVVLLLASAFVGQSLWRAGKTQLWNQRTSNFQSYSEAGAASATSATEQLSESSSQNTETQLANGDSAPAVALHSLRGQELRLERANDTDANNPSLSGASANIDTASDATSGPADATATRFNITYAEIPVDKLARWSADSASQGLYQSLSEYSAGILYDFKKYRADYRQSLKSSTLMIPAGSNNSLISGAMSEEGGQLLGLALSVEHKKRENDVTSGAINLTRNSSQSSESFPAEFELPAGAAFFIVGALKREHFTEDRGQLNMPPFQIFRSQDFMTRQTEFVIILEPDYN